MKLGVAEAVFGERPDLEIFHQDVALGDQLEGDRLTLGLGDVERDRSLVAVGADEIGALPRSRHEGRRKAARVVAGAGLFDLDDVGAEVRKHLHAGRSRQHPREIEHLDALERSGRLGHGLPFIGRPLRSRVALQIELRIARVRATERPMSGRSAVRYGKVPRRRKSASPHGRRDRWPNNRSCKCPVFSTSGD